MHDDTQPAMTYPTAAQYARWKAAANAHDMSVSAYMQAMIEAGRKKFDATVTPDEPVADLRTQRNDLKAELDRTRVRVHELEDQLHHGERATVRRYVETHPGASFEAIVQHVVDTVPARVNHHLDALAGEAVVRTTAGFYPADHDAVVGDADPEADGPPEAPDAIGPTDAGGDAS